MARVCRVPVRLSETLNLSYGRHFAYLSGEICGNRAWSLSPTTTCVAAAVSARYELCTTALYRQKPSRNVKLLNAIADVN